MGKKIMRAEREERSHNTKQQNTTYNNKERRKAKWRQKIKKNKEIYINIESLYSSF